MRYLANVGISRSRQEREEKKPEENEREKIA
jgi:hypothetical protein